MKKGVTSFWGGKTAGIIPHIGFGQGEKVKYAMAKVTYRRGTLKSLRTVLARQRKGIDGKSQEKNSIAGESDQKLTIFVTSLLGEALGLQELHCCN